MGKGAIKCDCKEMFPQGLFFSDACSSGICVLNDVPVLSPILKIHILYMGEFGSYNS